MLAESHSLAGALLGVWLIGIGLNYLPLSAESLALSRAGGLEAELASLDLGAERRRYTRRQFLLMAPFLVGALGLLQALARFRHDR